MTQEKRRKRTMLPGPRTSASKAAFGPVFGIGARHAAQLAETNTAMTLASVMMSVAWLEGCVNDLIDEILGEWYGGEYPSLALLRRMAGVSRLTEREAKLTHKLQVLSVCLAGHEVDASSTLYEDLTLALSIRNFITHPRQKAFEMEHFTTTEGTPSMRPRGLMPLTEALTRRRILKRPDPELIYSDFVAVQNPQVATWVHGVCRHVLEDVLSWLPAHYQKLTGLGMALHAWG